MAGAGELHPAAEAGLRHRMGLGDGKDRQGRSAFLNHDQRDFEAVGILPIKELRRQAGVAGVAVEGGDDAAFKSVARVEVQLGRTMEAAAKGERRRRQTQRFETVIEDGEPPHGGAMRDAAFAGERLLVEDLGRPAGGGAGEVFELVAVVDP